MRFSRVLPTLLALLLIQRADGEEKQVSSKSPPHAASISASTSSTTPTPSAGSEKGPPFGPGFLKTLSVIGVSELGDKTFFIAAIMAMKHPRRLVFLGAAGALTVMHGGSSLFGVIFALIPPLYVNLLSAGFFALFGIKLLLDGIKMSHEEASSELQEVTQEIQKKEEASHSSLETGGGSSSSNASSHLAPLLQTFTMTFLAEWGDRSQISTVVLAAKENLSAVILGGLLGHYLCSGLAVVGGRALSARISVKSVTILGGVVFLAFAVSTLLFSEESLF